MGAEKRSVVELTRAAKELLGKEEGLLGIQTTKEQVTIFVKSRMLYREIQEPFEKFGYKVECGLKARLSK